MDKKIISVTLFFIFIFFIGEGYNLGFIQKFGSHFLSPFACSFFPCAHLISKPKRAWKTYTDAIHGFSFRYPSVWNGGGTLQSEPGQPERPGISVNTYPLKPCVSAKEYVRNEIIPYYPHHVIHPIAADTIDGFVVEQLHLDNITTGPEAYIINCPYMIRLSYNPTGIPNSDAIFKKVLASVKTWKPSQ